MLNNDLNSPCGILYIDDEEKALKYFRMAFADKFKVFTASSGKEGLEILRREARHIGIVISDQRMPEMLGAELLGMVREEFPGIVRLLTTAYSDLDSAIQAVNKGHIYQYVVKPWEIPDLRMVLQRAADYYRVLSERNELLALKMTTLQRIVCSDRLKWLLLSGRSWDTSAQANLRRVLVGLIKALPNTEELVVDGGGKLSTQRFEISSLIRDEFHNASRCLDAMDKLRGAQPAPQASLKALQGALAEKYHLAPDQAELILEDGSANATFRLRPTDSSFSTGEFLKAIFGILFEQETSGLSMMLFETLFALAAA